MNSLNLGTIFGPHLLRPDTEDPQVLMECNSVSTNFVRAMVAHHLDLFPPTGDEHAPKRLSVVFQAGTVPPWLQMSDQPSKMEQQRSLYQAESKGRSLSFRPRQNSAPLDHKGRCKCARLSPNIKCDWLHM